MCTARRWPGAPRATPGASRCRDGTHTLPRPRVRAPSQPRADAVSTREHPRATPAYNAMARTKHTARRVTGKAGAAAKASRHRTKTMPGPRVSACRETCAGSMCPVPPPNIPQPGGGWARPPQETPSVLQRLARLQVCVVSVRRARRHACTARVRVSVLKCVSTWTDVKSVYCTKFAQTRAHTFALQARRATGCAVLHLFCVSLR